MSGWMVVLSGAIVIGIAWIIGRPVRQRNRIARHQAILDAIEALQPDGTGFTITEEASLLCGMRVGPADFYPLTQKLEAQGVLASRWGIATEERGWRRPRHYWFVGGKPSVEA